MWSFFWSVFSCIRTEYGDLLRTQENTDQKKLINIYNIYNIYKLYNIYL